MIRPLAVQLKAELQAAQELLGEVRDATGITFDHKTELWHLPGPPTPGLATLGDALKALIGKPDLGGYDPWIPTLSGEQLFLLHPDPELIHIGDIATALGNECRWSNQLSFYSVAEHSVLVSQLVPPEHALAGLLHDAAEAYLGDVAGPLRVLLGRVYADLDDMFSRIIAEKFGVEYPWSAEVVKADHQVAAYEVYSYFGSFCGRVRERAEIDKVFTEIGWLDRSGDVKIYGLGPSSAKSLFLDRFDELKAK